jgi:murein DD-endopeptidase MepM/ murein hydrolase activator NlpD
MLVCLAVLRQAHAGKQGGKPPATPGGVIHVVHRGETLFRISQAYQVSVVSLLEANRLPSGRALKIGQRLRIPGAAKVKSVEPYQPLTNREREALEQSLREEQPAPLPAPEPPRPGVRTDAEFVWPLVGPVNSRFGPRWGRFHAGIDIGSPHYQEIVAAADGEVIYAAETRGALGNVVVLRHGAGLRTVYGHLSVVVAREGQTVRQGQPIGGVGATGRATGPHLHFEVHRHGSPVNPEDLLPATIDDLVRDLSKPTGRAPPQRYSREGTTLRP